MRHFLGAALLMGMVPLVTHAQAPRTDVKKASDVRLIPTTTTPILLGESKPASFKQVAPVQHVAPQPLPVADFKPMPAISTTRVGPVSFGARLMAAWDEHNCAPDGCPKPIGCSNFWTEKKFIFGSCRQFFGTSEASIGHHRWTVLP